MLNIHRTGLLHFHPHSLPFIVQESGGAFVVDDGGGVSCLLCSGLENLHKGELHSLFAVIYANQQCPFRSITGRPESRAS